MAQQNALLLKNIGEVSIRSKFWNEKVVEYCAISRANKRIYTLPAEGCVVLGVPTRGSQRGTSIACTDGKWQRQLDRQCCATFVFEDDGSQKCVAKRRLPNGTSYTFEAADAVSSSLCHWVESYIPFPYNAQFALKCGHMIIRKAKKEPE